MLFVFAQTKIMVGDIRDWQDGTLAWICYDQKAILSTQKLWQYSTVQTRWDVAVIKVTPIKFFMEIKIFQFTVYSALELYQ